MLEFLFYKLKQLKYYMGYRRHEVPLHTIPPLLHLPPHAGSKNILRINKCCDEIKKLKTLFTNKNLDAHSLTILSPSRQHSLILVA